MESKREAKKADLKKRLIESAEALVLEKGLDGLNAREITARAGCALGALYNAFEHLDMLVLHVNSRTLAKLGRALKASSDDAGSKVEDKLEALAAAYVAFAVENRRLWSALFYHRLADGIDVPEWHLRDHEVLIEGLIGLIAELRPDLDEQGLLNRARTIFASVHGVVNLSLNGRHVGVPPEALATEVSDLVKTLTRGSRALQS